MIAAVCHETKTRSNLSVGGILQTSKAFDRQLKKLDKQEGARILAYLTKRVLTHPHPKTLAEPLVGSLQGYGRFRIGNYRVITDFQDHIMTIIVIEVAHRREVYH